MDKTWGEYESNQTTDYAINPGFINVKKTTKYDNSQI